VFLKTLIRRGNETPNPTLYKAGGVKEEEGVRRGVGAEQKTKKKNTAPKGGIWPKRPRQEDSNNHGEGNQNTHMRVKPTTLRDASPGLRHGSVVLALGTKKKLSRLVGSDRLGA